jgi:hypothetical protein
VTRGLLRSNLPRLLISGSILAITAWLVIFFPSLALGDPEPGHDRMIFLMTTVLPALAATFLLSGSVIGLRRIAQSPSQELSFARIGYIFAILFGPSSRTGV